MSRKDGLYLSCFVAVLFVAIALRAIGLTWGLPDVFEEATPLKKAWAMWNWGSPNPADLNPHFFNYPSLVIYLHFGVQGLLFLLLKLVGIVSSTMDYRVDYLFDPTRLYVVSRALSTAFAVATVWVGMRISRHVAGRLASIVAGCLLALNTFHILRSQMIEVDLPLTFFVAVALWRMILVTASPTMKNYVIVALAIGFAAATKYTGAFLVLPLICAHTIVIRSGKLANWGWRELGLSAAVAAVTFFVCSPYVILDFASFMRDFSLESEHMKLGHFGADEGPTLAFYGGAAVQRVVGVPVLLMSIAGLGFFAWKRRSWALILGAFVLVYAIIIISWRMRADRYLLPLLPVLVVFAGAMVGELAGLPRVAKLGATWRWVGVAGVTVVMAIPSIVSFDEVLARSRPDTRTAARLWVDQNIPAGAFIVAEPYGPDLYGVDDFVQLDPTTRKLMRERGAERPLYAMQTMPLFQARPEQSGAFYHIEHYEVADCIVTSSSVKSRYLSDPARFATQVAFYESLDERFVLEKTFEPGGGQGPVIVVYRNPAHRAPFNRRQEVDGPPTLDRTDATGKEDIFYYHLGLSYELFGYKEQALGSYALAFEYPITQAATFHQLILGRTRCLTDLGMIDEALAFLDMAIENAPSATARTRYQRLRQSIEQQQ